MDPPRFLPRGQASKRWTPPLPEVEGLVDEAAIGRLRNRAWC